MLRRRFFSSRSASPFISIITSFLASSSPAPRHSRAWCSSSTEILAPEEEATAPSSSPPPSSSLLQRYTQPGVLKRHPLELLQQVAAEKINIASAEEHRGGSGVSAATSWSVEEIQILTADAAKRLSIISRQVTDDDLDKGAPLSSSSAPPDDLAGAPAVDSIGASFVDGHSEAAAANFVEEQQRFDALHSTLFHGERTISDKLDAWFDNNRSGDGAAAAATEVVVVVDGSGGGDLGCLVSLLQRHILLARLCSRFDAAVEAFLLLISVRDRGVEVVVDVKNNSRRRTASSSSSSSSSTSEVEIPVITWRQLRDVMQACAAASSTSVGSVAAATTESNYRTAETLLRLAIKKFGGGESSLEQVVTTDVLTSLAKCIQNASDLQRFRQLMAVECSPPAGGGGGGAGGGGSLAHIPVSIPLYNELIFSCSRCSDEPKRVPVALALYRALGDNGLAPTPQTYAAMVATYAAEGLCSEAFSMFHEAKCNCDSAAVANCPPLYNHLIESYANAGKLHDAISTANVLIDAHAPLTRRGFHAALMCCAAQGDLSQCHDFLSVMQGGGNKNNNKFSSSKIKSSYNIPATPSTLAITLASLFFIRTEMNWKEKLTLAGDATSDALALLPVSASALADDGDDEMEGDSERRKFQREQKRVSVFCETEGFFCAVLCRVLGNVVCPPIFSAAATTIAPTQQPPKSQDEEAAAGETTKWRDEAGLYRHHLNLPLRMVQMHCQQTLCNLLERAVEQRLSMHVSSSNNGSSNNSASSSSSQHLEQERAAKRKRFAQSLLDRARAGDLFAPQTPTRMPHGAEVAALLPDVILNPSILAAEDDGGGGTQQTLLDNDEEADPSALLKLLQSVLPHATVFLLPFASVRAIVAEADALLHLNGHPLLQRELFGQSASLGESLVGASVETRNKTATMRNAQKSSSPERIIEVSERGAEASSSSSTSSPSSQYEARATEAGSLSHTEREARLDRLADAVLALAVFLKHHGDQVHIQSAAHDLDSSRASSVLHLDAACPVQAAAASSVAMLLCSTAFFAPGALKRAGEDQRRNQKQQQQQQQGDDRVVAATVNNFYSTFDLVHAARGHQWFCSRAQQQERGQKRGRRNNGAATSSSPSSSPPLCAFVDGVMKLQPALRSLLLQGEKEHDGVDQSSSSSSSSSIEVANSSSSMLSSLPSLLYFRAQANVSLVTCDAALKKKWSSHRHHQQHNGKEAASPFRTTAGQLQKFHRDAARLLLSNSSSSRSDDDSRGRSGRQDQQPEPTPFRSVSGVKLASLSVGNSRSNSSGGNQPREEGRNPQRRAQGFSVRIIDPTQVII